MKEKITDRGHYQEHPVEADAMRIAEGESRQLCLVPKEHLHFVLEKDSNLNLCLIMHPDTDTAVDIIVDFIGERASATLSGLYICSQAKLTINVEVRHRVGHCHSRQLFKGIVAGDSSTEFGGRIIVAPGAQATKAFQENHNLLLSDEARCGTTPQLEIYADDVECSHGATIGRLNEDERFYMCSRGISEQEAKVLQMISFLAPVLESIPEVSREPIVAKIEETVRSL